MSADKQMVQQEPLVSESSRHTPCQGVNILAIAIVSACRYLDAPAAALAPLSGLQRHVQLPAVTMVFCAIEHMDVLKVRLSGISIAILRLWTPIWLFVDMLPSVLAVFQPLHLVATI